MRDIGKPAELSPAEFEEYVRAEFDRVGSGIDHWECSRGASLTGLDGEYRIDVLVRFRLMGLKFQVVVECKRHRRRVEREDLQVLMDRVRSTGSSKGVLYSTSGFQSGAVKYAKLHGIGLVRVVDGLSLYEARSAGPTPARPPPWVTLPRFAGYLVTQSEHGETHSLVSEQHPEALRQWFLQA